MVAGWTNVEIWVVYFACCVGVCGCAVCGVVWIATGFFCGNAAPGVKNPCEPCGGTGFVARNGGKFVPANLGMERDAADAAPASATSETTPEQQDALLRRLAESNVEITDEVCHRCEAATLARHEAATPQAWKAATVCTGACNCVCARCARWRCGCFPSVTRPRRPRAQPHGAVAATRGYPGYLRYPLSAAWSSERKRCPVTTRVNPN